MIYNIHYDTKVDHSKEELETLATDVSKLMVIIAGHVLMLKGKDKLEHGDVSTLSHLLVQAQLDDLAEYTLHGKNYRKKTIEVLL